MKARLYEAGSTNNQDRHILHIFVAFLKSSFQILLADISYFNSYLALIRQEPGVMLDSYKKGSSAMIAYILIYINSIKISFTITILSSFVFNDQLRKDYPVSFFIICWFRSNLFYSNN